MTTGLFLLSAKAKGFLTLHRSIEVTAKQRSFTIDCVRQPSTYNLLSLSALDALTGAPIKGVLFLLSPSLNVLPEEGLSDSHGTYDFPMTTLGAYTLTTVKQGYMQAMKTIEVTPAMLSSQENYRLCVPMMRGLESFDKGTKVAIVEANMPMEGMELKVEF